MARDWNDYESKIREEIERKVARAQAHAERKAERLRERAERASERFKERAEWYAEKVKERAEREAEQAKETIERNAEQAKEQAERVAERAKEGYYKATGGGSPWANRVYPFGIRLHGFGCDGAGDHSSEILIGLAILGFGAALLVANLGIFAIHDVFAFWPMILIAAGIMRLSRARFASARGFGIFLILAGFVILLGNFHVIRVSWNLFWPAILILVGLQHLLRNFDPPKAEQQAQPGAPQPPPVNPFATPGTPQPPSSSPLYGPETPTSGPRPVDVAGGPQFAGAAVGEGPSSAPPPPPPPQFSSQPPPPPPGVTMEPDVHLHEYCIFTGGKRRILTNNFRGGEVVAVFGGVEVDLRGSQIGGDEAVVDITAAFGGCNIKVPMNWYVEMRGVAAFGGYSNKTIPPRLSPGQRIQKLVVTGSAAFGGVVIEN